jgi:chemotaxis protein methyltransferase CheR
VSALQPAGEAPGGVVSLSERQFEALQGVIHRHLGIHLNAQKRAMLEGRVSRLLRERGVPLELWLQQIMASPSREDLAQLANHVSTNHTYFNREPEHFEFLRRVALPELEARAGRTGRKELRMWCAAASTGEEPYTLAMLQMEHFGAAFGQWDAGLLATDISESALATARAGVYPANRVEALPAALRHAWLIKRPDGDYEFKLEVKRQVLFRQFNLITPKFLFKKKFDIIFCRNVMIYFDQPTKEALIRRFYDCLQPGGLLFLGMAEVLVDPGGLFAPVQSAVYRRSAGW